MLIETAMGLAAWQLKIIIDNVVGSHNHNKMSPRLDHTVRPMLEGGGKMQVAGLAALAFVVMAMLGAERPWHSQKYELIYPGDFAKWGRVDAGAGALLPLPQFPQSPPSAPGARLPHAGRSVPGPANKKKSLP